MRTLTHTPPNPWHILYTQEAFGLICDVSGTLCTMDGFAAPGGAVIPAHVGPVLAEEKEPSETLDASFGSVEEAVAMLTRRRVAPLTSE